mmetsp:Transcript_15999/g.17789  ORF Transcript_15999/g.17789 Transcript_15999/m.17789 type:complete len:85 (+) Transcript_15999:577-831(+)
MSTIEFISSFIAIVQPIDDPITAAKENIVYKKSPPPTCCSIPPPIQAKDHAINKQIGRNDPTDIAITVFIRSYPKIFVTEGMTF